eukprot:gnl/Spiro4/4081_TR2035_c0_g1_i1.p1 gnl/Spiro4/4081_TR2035_c0_g1~~gnl/Spiro4/4081_TR2035_c0_g1_i1.p1  ORF type:complete len:429 (+),score=135.12 gnl/Spiro4/4081_TR2035_c0_g1_i1:59-1345(+)
MPRAPGASRARSGLSAQCNFTQKVCAREFHSAARVGPTRLMRGADVSAAKFRNLRVVSSNTLDTHDAESSAKKPLGFMRRRSKVVELVATGSLVFALTQAGVCAAFDRATNRRLCFLSARDDEVIRSLFINKLTHAVITVSVYKRDGYSSLHCRSTPLLDVRHGNGANGVSLFPGESLSWPGFVEFDEVNSKVVTYSATHTEYKIWDMRTSKLQFRVDGALVQEIKTCAGLMLLIGRRKTGYVPLTVLNIENGQVLRTFRQILNRTKRVEFVEIFNDCVLLKQADHELRILDIATATTRSVAGFVTPAHGFAFLPHAQMFLAIHTNCVQAFNSKAELVAKLENQDSARASTALCVSAAQDVVVAYQQHASASSLGEVAVWHVATGKCVARVAVPADGVPPDVTALLYNDDLHELYLGRPDGVLSVVAT